MSNRTVTIEIPLPVWANYMATDEDGEVWVYATKPKIGMNCKQWANGSDRNKKLCYGLDGENWKDSLVKL